MSASEALRGWLPRLGVEIGRTGIPGPDWLVTADLGALRAAAGGLEQAADDLDATRIGLRQLLDSPGDSLGWHGDAAAAADGSVRRSGTALAEMADLLRRLGRAMSRHAMRIEDWREELGRVLDQAEEHAAALGPLLPGAHPFTLVRDPADTGPDHLAALNQCAGRLQEVLADAEAGDRECASAVVDLGAAVLDLTGVAEADDWVAGVVPSGVRQALGDAGSAGQGRAEQGGAEQGGAEPPGVTPPRTSAGR
ncbi:MAG: hypothetical protein ACRDYU_04195 [Actinomycetes bacterium]